MGNRPADKEEERPKRARLSVILVTLNEEANLSACLESVSFAEEIVVVDAGSTDRTQKVALHFGCRLFVYPWKNYGNQKNYALAQCSHEWVLSLDADERIPFESRIRIEQVLENPAADAFIVYRKNFFHGRWIRHAGWWPDASVRLFQKKGASFSEATHARLTCGKRVKTLGVAIEHYSYNSYSHMINKMDRYSTQVAHELFNAGKKATGLSPICHGAWMFFRTYFLEKGFLDGIEGLVIALTRAGSSFFKYAKLLEQIQQAKNPLHSSPCERSSVDLPRP